jgi:hypothetical protein
VLLSTLTDIFSHSPPKLMQEMLIIQKDSAVIFNEKITLKSR